MFMSCLSCLFVDIDVEMDEIEERIFLGNVEAAESKENICLHRITHILSKLFLGL